MMALFAKIHGDLELYLPLWFPGKKKDEALYYFQIHATPIATPGEQPVFAG